MKHGRPNKSKVIPYEYAPNKTVDNVEKAFKTIFGDSIDIITKHVRRGGVSSTVYVPKEYQDKLVTLIIWKNKERYYKPKEKKLPQIRRIYIGD